MENKYLKRINEFSRIAKERELTDEEKHARSHRGKALRAMRDELKKIYANTDNK